MERIYTLTPDTRQFFLSWIRFLKPFTQWKLLKQLPSFLNGLFRYLNDSNPHVRLATINLLTDFLKEIHDLVKEIGGLPSDPEEMVDPNEIREQEEKEKEKEKEEREKKEKEREKEKDVEKEKVKGIEDKKKTGLKGKQFSGILNRKSTPIPKENKPISETNIPESAPSLPTLNEKSIESPNNQNKTGSSEEKEREKEGNEEETVEEQDVDWNRINMLPDFVKMGEILDPYLTSEGKFHHLYKRLFYPFTTQSSSCH